MVIPDALPGPLRVTVTSVVGRLRAHLFGDDQISGFTGYQRVCLESLTTPAPFSFAIELTNVH
jgi:hypothetical protein